MYRRILLFTLVMVSNITWAAAVATAQDSLPATDFEALSRRLHEAEQRIRSLEMERLPAVGQQATTPVGQVSPNISGSTPASPVGLTHAEGTSIDGSPRVEKVEIQTKPNHKLKGRIFFDQIQFDDAKGLGVDRENELGFDTLRIGIGGNIFENVKYEVEVEFEGTEVDYKTVYIELVDLPMLGDFRAGHFYEPIGGLDEDSGSKYQMFMERSQSITAFVPSRSFGYMFHHDEFEEAIYWAVGAFRHESDDSPDKGGTILGDAGDWVCDARLAWNPYYDEPSEGRYLVHLGTGYSYRTDATFLEFSTDPELGRGDSYIETTVPDDNDYHLIVPEFLVIWGPWSVQSEFQFVPTGSANFWGGYVEGSFFLTGDHRGYRRQDKTLSRVKPIENFFSIRTPIGCCCGKGAWELKARWSYVDLREGVGALRGMQNNVTLGVNWYLNEYTRIMFDYLYEDINRLIGDDGIAHGVGTRIQVEF